jgi:hypothetical protein
LAIYAREDGHIEHALDVHQYRNFTGDPKQSGRTGLQSAWDGGIRNLVALVAHSTGG